MRSARLVFTLLIATAIVPAVGSPAIAMTAGPGKLAFMRDGQVVITSPDGSDPVALGQQRYPRWSPDGSRVMVTASNKIVTFDANGSDETTLFKSPSDFTAYGMDWSPTGRKIVVQLRGRFWDLAIVTLRTGEWERITFSEDRELVAEWSPDGTRIAYAIDGGIFILELATGDTTGPVPTTSTEYVSRVDWTPDSAGLIYVENNGRIRRWSLLSPDANPTSVYNPPGHLASASFTPDGRILFDLAEDRFTPADLYTIASDGTDLQQITSTPDQDETSADQQPAVLELRADRRTITYGDAIVLTAQLYPVAETTNLEVSFYRSVGIEPFRLVATKTVDASGIATLRQTPDHHTSYIVRWSGDATSPPVASGELKTRVRVFLDAWLRRSYGRDGEYRLYREGNDVYYVGILLPPQDNGVSITVEKRRRNGDWRYWGSGAFFTRRDGTYAVAIRSPARGRYRVRSGFEDTRQNLGTMTDNAYFRVT
jgi:hypothetical protein